MKVSERWVEVTPSQFPHEKAGLDLLRAVLPDAGPFRAWSNFEFRDTHGKWHEIDLLVLGRQRLHLVELKYYSGTLGGDDHRWVRDGRPTEDSPLKLARRKAQRLRSVLRREFTAWSGEGGPPISALAAAVPYIQECVFLHHPGLRCALAGSSAIDLFGLDARESASGLPGISQRLLEPAGTHPRQSVDAQPVDIIPVLLQRMGLARRGQREVGTWVLDEHPVAEGEGWQDWLAHHRVDIEDRSRIRFTVAAPGSSAAQIEHVRWRAMDQYQVLRGLSHEVLLRPKDVVDADLGLGLVYPYDDRYQRLDLWLGEKSDPQSMASRAEVIHQLAGAVRYTHQNRLFCKGLNPQTIGVRASADGRHQVLMDSWQPADQSTGAPEKLLEGLIAAGSDPDGDPVDVGQRRARSYSAPEFFSSLDADPVRLDIFTLGALAYFIVSGEHPASDRIALVERLRTDGGLALPAGPPAPGPGLRAAILAATRPSPWDRPASVQEFLDLMARPDDGEGAKRPAVTASPPPAVPAFADAFRAGGSPRPNLMLTPDVDLHKLVATLVAEQGLSASFRQLPSHLQPGFTAFLTGLSLAVVKGSLTWTSTTELELHWPSRPVPPPVALHVRASRFELKGDARDAPALASLARSVRLGLTVEVDLSDTAAEVRSNTQFFLAGLSAPLAMGLEITQGGSRALVYRR